MRVAVKHQAMAWHPSILLCLPSRREQHVQSVRRAHMPGPHRIHLDDVAVEKLDTIILGQDAQAAQLFILVRGELVS
jgi:hypothetical protein